jgi:hypothetical protein
MSSKASGVLDPPADLIRSFVSRSDTYTLIHYGEAAKGGHFAALDQPEILISKIRTGLRSLRH